MIIYRNNFPRYYQMKQKERKLKLKIRKLEERNENLKNKLMNLANLTGYIFQREFEDKSKYSLH